MALIRWQPFHEMDALQRDMNRLFETLASSDRNSTRQGFMPLAEMEHTEDSVHLRVEIPGMNADDIDVQVTKDAVMITGERKSKSKTENNNIRRSEFHYGSFQRTVPLPVAIDNTQVRGDYRDGILDLELPILKQPESKVTKVKIGSNSKPKDSHYSGDKSQSSVPKNIVAEKEAINSDDYQESTADSPSSENGGYGNVDAWNETPEDSAEKATAN